MKFRSFHRNDLNEIVSVFIDTLSRPPWNDQWGSAEQAARYLKEFVDNPVFRGFIVSLEGKIIGVCFGHLRSWYSGKEYFINEFFIAHEQQGRGIGTALLNYIKQTLAQTDGAKQLVLLTVRRYPAYRFYLKNGFIPQEGDIFMCLKC